MLALENVVIPKATNSKGEPIEIKFQKEFIPLVEAVALKYPTWTLEPTYIYTMYDEERNEYKEVRRVKVMDKYEMLGELGMDYDRRLGYKFWINNHRVQDMRERGSGMKTIHLAKAMKHIEKYFGAKSVKELVTQASIEAREIMRGISNSKQWEMQNAWGRIQGDAMLYVIENIEAFSAAVSDTIVKEALAKLPIKYRESQECNLIGKAITSDNYNLVVLQGSNYLMSVDNQPPQVMDSEALPAFVRRGIGMLKLVENGQIVSGVGLRVNETTFAILPESNNVSGEVL